MKEEGGRKYEEEGGRRVKTEEDGGRRRMKEYEGVRRREKGGRRRMLNECERGGERRAVCLLVCIRNSLLSSHSSSHLVCL